MKKSIAILVLFLSTITFAQNKIYVHTVNQTATQTYSIIDHPDLNNNPDAQVIVKQHWKGEYNDHPIGVYYSTDASKWVIYNEDRENIVGGAAFNVFIGDNKDSVVFFFTIQKKGFSPEP